MVQTNENSSSDSAKRRATGRDQSVAAIRKISTFFFSPLRSSLFLSPPFLPKKSRTSAAWRPFLRASPTKKPRPWKCWRGERGLFCCCSRAQQRHRQPPMIASSARLSRRRRRVSCRLAPGWTPWFESGATKGGAQLSELAAIQRDEEERAARFKKKKRAKPKKWKKKILGTSLSLSLRAEKKRTHSPKSSPAFRAPCSPAFHASTHTYRDKKSSTSYDERPLPAPLLDRGAVVQRTRREQGDGVDSHGDRASSSPLQHQRRRVQVRARFLMLFAA